MKKNYLFTLLLTFSFSIISFGQVILAEGFDYADGSLVPNGGWAREGGTSGDFQVVSGEAVVQHGTPSEDVKLAFTEISGSVYVAFDFSVDDLGAVYSGSDNEYFAHLDFKARVDIVPPSANGDYSIGISSAASTADVIWATDLIFGTKYRALIKHDQDTGTASLWIDPSSSTDTSIVGAEDGANSVKEFELRQSDSSENETIRVDNLMIGQTFDDVLVFSAPTEPSLSIAGVTDNQVFPPETTEVPVSLNINNFTLSGDDGSGNSDGSGDGYIKGTLQESGQQDDTSNQFSTTPENIPVNPGSSYTLIAELVDNDGNSLSPVVSSSVSFSVATYSQIASLADLRTATEGNYYDLSNEVVLTYVGSSRNQKYIQDATGAILIDDNDGIITTSYNVGDGITGIQGKLGSFGGVLQFIPQGDPGNATSTGNAISAQVVTIGDLTANFEDYESEWITINDVSFSDADGSAVFGSGQNYDITDGTNTLVFRTAFSNADLIGEIIPSSSANITGLASEFNGTFQIFGTSLADIVLGINNNIIEGFGTYPNPVSNGKFVLSTSSSDVKQVSIYNVLGKKVFVQSVSGIKSDIDVSLITSGVYILKVTEGNKTATSKLVIK
jgi:hypothetical protein